MDDFYEIAEQCHKDRIKEQKLDILISLIIILINGIIIKYR